MPFNLHQIIYSFIPCANLYLNPFKNGSLTKLNKGAKINVKKKTNFIQSTLYIYKAEIFKRMKLESYALFKIENFFL